MSESTEAPAAPPAGPVDALAALPLRTLVERLCGLEATLTAGGAVSNALRAAALRRMVERWREDEVAPTGRAPGLGTVSLTLPQQKVVVADADAFASWLAEHHPTEVDARITLTLPAAMLPGVLEVIETELLDAEMIEALNAPDPADATPDELAALQLARALRDRAVEVAPKPQFTKLLLEKLCTVAPAGVDAEGQAYAAAVFGADGSPIDGVKVVPGADPTARDADGNPTGPQPTSISVRLESEAKARAVAAATAQFDALLAGQPAVLGVDVEQIAGGNPEELMLAAGLEGEVLSDVNVARARAALEPEAADAEPSYDDDEGIPADAAAIDVLGLAAWRAMRKPQLQEECRRLSLDDSGTVKDLRGRLADWAATTAGMPS